MKIIIDIRKTDNENMALLDLEKVGDDDDNMAVFRMTSRLMRVITFEFANIHAESEYLKLKFIDKQSEKEEE